jgi:hypothetical protein
MILEVVSAAVQHVILAERVHQAFRKAQLWMNDRH